MSFPVFLTSPARLTATYFQPPAPIPASAPQPPRRPSPRKPLPPKPPLHRPPRPLGLLTRLICLVFLMTGNFLQFLITRRLRKKRLSAAQLKTLLAWRAQLNEAAIRRLRR